MSNFSSLSLFEFPKTRPVKELMARNAFTWFKQGKALFLLNKNVIFEFQVHGEKSGDQRLEAVVLLFSSSLSRLEDVRQSSSLSKDSSLHDVFYDFLLRMEASQPLEGLRLSEAEVEFWIKLLKKHGYDDLFHPKPEKENPLNQLVEKWFRRS